MNRKSNFAARLTSLVQSRGFCYALLFILTFALHLVMNMYSSDDAVMRSLTYDSLFSFMVERYLTWSTRIFTDTIFMVLLRAPSILWRILDSAVYTLFALALSYLVSGLKSRKTDWVLAALFLLYPFIDMVSAGWIVTTCVYLWSAAAVSFALVPLRMCLVDDKKPKGVWIAVGVIFSFLAGSQEQACCTLIAVSGLILVYALINKKFRPLMAVTFGVGLIMLCVHLLSPALPIRDVAEAAGWYPNFAEVPFLNRLEMGFSATLYHYLMEPNLIFLAYSVFVFARLIQLKRKPFILLAGGIPLFLSLVFGFGLGFDAFNASFPALGAVRTALGFQGTNPVWGDWDSFLPLLVLIVSAAAILVSLYQAFKDSESGLLSIYVLLAGTAVRMVLGFSPTIWGSGYRTFIILYFVFVYLTARIAADMDAENRRFLPHALPVLSVFALCQYITSLLSANAVGQ